jgi:hypothetical protein
MKPSRPPIHPFLFAVYPILNLLATNRAQTLPGQAARALLLSLALAAALYFLSFLLLRDAKRAALLASLALIATFSYGHAALLLGDPPHWLPSAWIAVWALLAWRLLAEARNHAALSAALGWVGGFALLPGALVLALYPLQMKADDVLPLNGALAAIEQEAEEMDIDEERLPDIYYIILDGYGRADALAEFYGYDNRQMIDYLERRGFYVAHASYANYNQTFLSLPSSLNMEHIMPLLGVEPGDDYNYAEHIRLIRDSALREVLEELGYETVTFNSGFALTRIENSDHYLTPRGEAGQAPTITSLSLFGAEVGLNRFEALLVETTLFQPLFRTLLHETGEPPEFQEHRQRIQFIFEQLPAFAAQEGPYFVFAHVIAPHPPFVFKADGSPRPNILPFSYSDANHWVWSKGTRSEYVEGYREQLIYINSLLIEAIQEILAESDRPPVIIVQGDHGPGAYFAWESLENTQLEERMGILNAYYFPGGDRGLLYPTITPVNSFRVLLNRYFGFDLPLLEDRSYFSPWSEPYDFVDITGLLEKSARFSP